MVTAVSSSRLAGDLASGLPVPEDGAGGNLVMALAAVVVVFILLRALQAVWEAMAAFLGPLLVLLGALALAVAVAVTLMTGLLSGGGPPDPPVPEPEVVAPVAGGA